MHAPLIGPPPPAEPTRRAVVGVAASLACLTVAWRVLTFAGFNNDHHIYLAGAQQVLLGEWPVRDFVDPGWPLMTLLPALARWLFGSAALVELLLVSAAFALATAWTVAAAARLSGSVWIAGVVGLIEILINPRSFGYPKLTLYALAAWLFVSYARKPSRARLAGLAVLATVAFLFRHDHGLYVGTGALVVVLAAHGTHGARQSLREGARLAALTLLLLIPWIVWVQVYLGFPAYIRPALEFSRSEAEGTLLRQLPTLDGHQALLTPDNCAVLLFYLFHGLPLVAAGLAVRRGWRQHETWRGESAAVVAIAAMAVVANLGFLRSPLVARVPDAAAAAMVLLAWLCCRPPVGASIRRRVLQTTGAVAALATVGVVVGTMTDLSNELSRAGIIGRPGSFEKRVDDLGRRLMRTRPERDHVPSRNSLALGPFFAFLDRCTGPDDRLVMTGLSPDVFVMANRGFAGGQMAFRPNFYRQPSDQARAVARMSRQSVPFFIVDLEEEGEFRQWLGSVAAYLDAHYVPLADVPVPNTKGLRIFVERDRPAVAVDPGTGWPCFTRPAGA